MVNDRKQQDQYVQLMSDADLTTELRLEMDPDYQSLIDRAVAQLPPQQQKVFMLRQKGLKNPEIAKQLEISTDSVKKYQQWALKSVTEFIKTRSALFSILFL